MPALALAFTLAPQLLLLDEPTNHLDMRAIRLLEARSQDELKNQRSLVVITHDRAFLDKVATRIVELDRGVLRSYPGNFAAYETRKEEELAAEELERRRFDKFWAQEEVWIRKGIEADARATRAVSSGSNNCVANGPPDVIRWDPSACRSMRAKKAAKLSLK